MSRCIEKYTGTYYLVDTGFTDLNEQLDYKTVCEIVGRVILEKELREIQLQKEISKLQFEKQQILAKLTNAS